MYKIKNIQKRYFAKNNSQFIVETSLYILKEAYINDEHFNALKVKFGYAVTCHKAQGGEWDKVILNCKHSSKGLNSEYFRWLYTGITRTKENLFLINTPNIDIKMISTIAPVKKEEMGNIQENLLLFLNDLLNPLGIKVDSINEINNGFNIVFSKESEATQVGIYYKKDNKISSINKSGKSSDLQNEICNILEKLKGTNLNQREEKESGNTEKITFDEKFLEDFYNRIVSIVSKDNICVEIEITRQYLQRYKFTKGDKTAFIDFHYNGRKQFKRYTPQTGMSLDNDFLNSICELIGKI
jgi:superfamily I DNA/RNA helicase